MANKAKLTDLILCWPSDVPARDDGGSQEYAAIVTEVVPPMAAELLEDKAAPGKIRVHYWRTRPDGEVVAEFPNVEASPDDRGPGAWWRPT